ncbi:MAG: phycobiliprotein lyase, partial [Cyanobacteria bacterium P01_H01_bin.153]
MSIVNFFETVAGTWFSQRTTHFAPGQPSQTGQTTLKITHVDLSNPRIATVCQQCNADANAVIFAFLIQQEGQASLYGSGSSAPKSTTLMVGLKSANPAAGQFISQTEGEPA